MLTAVSESARQFRRWTFINCWSLRDRESAALWALYVPPSGGVAIKSSVRRLIDCFGAPVSPPDWESHARTHVGMVNYVDYDEDWIPENNTLYPFVHKRHSFDFESEVRAVIQRFPVGDQGLDFGHPVLGGLSVGVDLAQLIDAIHVAPTAPGWFADLARSVTRRYGCDAPVIQASLAGAAVY